MKSTPTPITYSVIVRNPNSWSASTGMHEELANCGHNHKSFATAQACYDRLTAWRDGATSARWYHAQIEDSTGHKIDRDGGAVMTFDELVTKYGAYSKGGVEYAITQYPYLDTVAGSSTGYVVSGETYYFAVGYNRAGEPYRLIWDITNPGTDDESDACDWTTFEAEPALGRFDLAPWHPEA